MPRSKTRKVATGRRTLPGLSGDMNAQVMYLSAKALQNWIRTRKWSREDRSDGIEAAGLIAELIEENEGDV